MESLGDIASELAKLHELTGADYSRQVERIARMNVFHPLTGDPDILTVGSEGGDDYERLIAAARKAVEHGYTVYILPNPKGMRTADFIFERKGAYKIIELKTILGQSSAGASLMSSIGQTNRVLLNIATNYNARRLASDIKAYFEANRLAQEVIIFKGKKIISIKRLFCKHPSYFKKFCQKYAK